MKQGSGRNGGQVTQLMPKLKLNPAFMGLFAVATVSVFGYLIVLGSHASSCTVSAKLVNSCRPWLAAFANSYPEAGSTLKAQTLYHEQRIGRQLDVVHDYRSPGTYSLSSDDIYFAQRANTTLLVNWKPADPWAQGAGGNATINADIDKMADSIKSVGAHKVMLTLYHEPEDNVTSDPNCAKPGGSGSYYKGNSGTPTDYRNMWANVENRFATRGVTNVVWVMNYMGYLPSWSCIENDLWPGNNLVDWVLYDPYISSSGWNSNISPFYSWMASNSNAAHNYASKPWGLGEWGAMTNLSQAQAESAYDQAKAALDNNTYPNLKLYDVFDCIGGGDFRVGYSVSGTKDQIEQNHYNAFANDAHIVGTATPATPVPTPKPTAVPISTPKPTAAPTANPTNPPPPASSGGSSSNPPPVIPTSGGTVSGTVDLGTSAGAADTSGVQIDGQSVPVSANGTLDTSLLPNGTHELTVTTIDPGTGQPVTTTRKITVKNALNPLEVVRNALYLPFHGNVVLANTVIGGILLVVICGAAIGGWLVWRKYHLGAIRRHVSTLR